MSDPSPADNTTPRPSPPFRELGLLAIGGIGLIALMAWWGGLGGRRGTERVRVRQGGAQSDGGYVGARACRECHPGEYALFTGSGHAKTLRPASERHLAAKLDGRTIADPEFPGVSWTFDLDDGSFGLVREEAGRRERLPIDYAFGSGHHATTFLSMLDRDPEHPSAREHRITYYAADDSLGITPGQTAEERASGRSPVGRDLDSYLSFKCFNCHTTRTSAASPLLLDVATTLPNVSCERCHGPGAAHVASARRGMADRSRMSFGYDSWTTPQQMRLCGHCHRHPDMAPPGDLRPDNPELSRFQPAALMQSPCYRHSGGALTCVTCHDPHARAEDDRSAYEPACLSCHGEGPRRECPVSPASGCIDCHMPRVDSGQGILFTDHWIRVRRDGAASRPDTPHGTVSTGAEPSE